MEQQSEWAGRHPKPVSWDPLPQPPSWYARPKNGVAWEVTVALLLTDGLVCALAGLFLLELWWADRIMPGIHVLNVDLGGLTRDEAREHLAASFDHPPGWYPTLHYGSQSWPVDPEALGVHLDVDATVAAALAVGHRGDLATRFQEQIGVLRRGYKVEPLLAAAPPSGSMFLSQIAHEINHPSRNASLQLGDDLAVVVTPAQTGREVDEMVTQQLLVQRALEKEGGDVDLVVHESPPILTDLSATEDQINLILSEPITLSTPDFEPWIIEPEELANWLVLQPAVDQDGQATLEVGLDLGPAAALAEEIAGQVARKSKDARFRYDVASERVIPVVQSIVGQTLDVTSTVSLIEHAATSEERSIPLPLVEIPPAISTKDVPNVASFDLIGEGTSNFAGSSAARIQNIGVGAAQFDGVLVAPGQTFSFNHYLGEVTAEKGYAESIIIWGNETRTDVGGGLCQVSSTAFRAAFWAGVPVTERLPHLFRVSYYEPPRGMDATIYSPYTDLKWVNDTEGFILIRTYMDTANKNLTFRFYGQDSGRTVEMDGPHETRIKEPPPPLNRPTSTLYEGQKRQIEWAKDGMDVTVYRIVKENGKEVRRDEFFSRYKPWQAVYLVGTKQVPTPTPAPQPTPEPTPEPASASAGG
jgi:vancomycin resistance protein YoaR